MRLRKVLRKIHRWIGLLASLWLLQLASTGWLLQHADDFGLTKSYVKSPFMLKWFGYGKRQKAWDFKGQTFYQIDDVISFNNHQNDESDEIIAVNKWNDQWIVATEYNLAWYNNQAKLIDQMDDFDGLPVPLSMAVVMNDQLYIQSNGQWFQMTHQGDLIEVQGLVPKVVSSQRSLTDVEQQQLFAAVMDNKLSYDKVIHSIHSGLKGSKWLNSISALALLYLSLSGIFLFLKKPKSNRRS